MKATTRFLKFLRNKIFHLKKIRLNWLFHQRQVTVASMAMICFYTLLLCVGISVFFSFNQIPSRTYSIVAEELNDKDGTYQSQYRLDSMHIRINIPMSMVQKDSSKNGSIEVYPAYTELKEFYKDTTIYDMLNVHKVFDNEAFDSIKEKHPVFKKMYDKDYVHKYSIAHLLYSTVEYLKELDSLKHIADSIPVIKDTIKNSYYIKATCLANDMKVSEKISVDNEVYHDSAQANDDIFNDYIHVDGVANYTLESGLFCFEDIMKVDKHGIYKYIFNTSKNSNKGPLVAPGWFTMSDISQMYVDLSFRTISIEAPSIKIDFKSAASFSNIYPIPDIIDYSSIQFNSQEKIEYIKLNGLKFHVSFPELQNKQSVRLFALTALMSFLFTFLIGNLFALILASIFRKKAKE